MCSSPSLLFFFLSLASSFYCLTLCSLVFTLTSFTLFLSLGTFPSTLSRATHFHFAHKRSPPQKNKIKNSRQFVFLAELEKLACEKHKTRQSLTETDCSNTPWQCDTCFSFFYCRQSVHVAATLNYMPSLHQNTHRTKKGRSVLYVTDVFPVKVQMSTKHDTLNIDQRI